MLVVTRKPGEKIVLPALDIEVTVVAVLPNGRVRLGIKAPDKIRVLREELLAGKESKR
jgi:carbon storage regulator CsrA